MKITVGILIGAASLTLASTAQAKPCSSHPVKAEKGKVNKAACLKQHKRNKMDWPPSPKEWEIKRRVGSYNWKKAARVANCETGGTRGAHPTRGNARWYITANGTPTGSYVGAHGMFARTFAYGVKRTGYRGRTYQEQVAIAVAAHPITGGWGGWGCRGA